MTRLKILLTSFLIFLTCRAKSLKESITDNENSSQAIKITPSGLVNNKESITVYLKNDDILSISEFTKYNNPEEHHPTHFRFIKESGSEYVKKVSTKNDELTLEFPKSEKYNEENKTERSVDVTIVESKEEIRETKTDGLSTETDEIESTTISIKGQDETSELIEGYENDLESPQHIETTESFFRISDSIDETNSNKQEDIMSTIPSRRSFFPNETLVLDNEDGISNKSVETEKVDQNTVQKSDIMSSKKANDQSQIESTPETPFVAPQEIYPLPVIFEKQFNNLSALPTLKITGPEGLSEKSEGETSKFGLIKTTPDEYKQSNNLDKSDEIATDMKSIDDYNSNIYENTYQYTPPKVKTTSQQSLTNQTNFNSLYSKLNQASEHPFLNRKPLRQNFGNYGAIIPNFNLQNHYLQNSGTNSNLQNHYLQNSGTNSNLQNHYLQNSGPNYNLQNHYLQNSGTNFNPQNHYLQNVVPYNYVRRVRRYSSCKKCGKSEHKLYRN